MTSQAPVAPAKKSSFAQSYINTNSIVGVRWPCPGSNTMSSGHVHSCLRIIFAVNKYFTSANRLKFPDFIRKRKQQRTCAKLAAFINNIFQLFTPNWTSFILIFDIKQLKR